MTRLRNVVQACLELFPPWKSATFISRAKTGEYHVNVTQDDDEFKGLVVHIPARTLTTEIYWKLVDSPAENTKIPMGDALARVKCYMAMNRMQFSHDLSRVQPLLDKVDLGGLTQEAPHPPSSPGRRLVEWCMPWDTVYVMSRDDGILRQMSADEHTVRQAYKRYSAAYEEMTEVVNLVHWTLDPMALYQQDMGYEYDHLDMFPTDAQITSDYAEYMTNMSASLDCLEREEPALYRKWLDNRRDLWRLCGAQNDWLFEWLALKEA